MQSSAPEIKWKQGRGTKMSLGLTAPWKYSVKKFSRCSDNMITCDFTTPNSDKRPSWKRLKVEVWFPGLSWQCLNWLSPTNSKLRFVWLFLNISSIIVVQVLFFLIIDLRTFFFRVISVVILDSYSIMFVVSLTNLYHDNSCAKKG